MVLIFNITTHPSKSRGEYPADWLPYSHSKRELTLATSPSIQSPQILFIQQITMASQTMTNGESSSKLIGVSIVRLRNDLDTDDWTELHSHSGRLQLH